MFHGPYGARIRRQTLPGYTPKSLIKRAFALYSSSSKSDTDAFYESVRRLSVPHSNPGAFIAQIAAMNRAFARGSMVIVSAKAVNGHTDMLTKSGH